MRNVVMSRVAFEGLESRKLMSAVASAASSTVATIGATSGVTAQATTPHFTDMTTTFADGSVDMANTNASRDTSIQIQFDRASSGGGIDAAALNRGAIQITNMSTGVVYNGNFNSSSPAPGTGDIRTLLRKVSTSGGGDVLVIVPSGLWQANTTFKVEVNGSYAASGVKVKDVNGNFFDAFGSSTTTFTTGVDFPKPSAAVSNVHFTQKIQTAAANRPYIADAIGPDHRFYTATSDGYIYRYDIGADGTLSNEFQITTVRDNNGGGRIITGITFDPGSTAGNLVLWVSHGQHAFGNDPNGSDPVEKYADNFTGKISRISGANLENYQDIIVGIPRSAKDHMNNQMVFSPDGRTMYFGIAAMNAMGAADSTWGNRPENIYSATIMQLRLGSGPTGITTYLHAHGAVNLTLDGGNNATGLDPTTWHYNIFKGSNPLRIYADGVRNTFDMVWGSNGHLYAAINGSSAGGSAPATPSDLSTVPTTYRPDKDIKGTTYTGPRAPALTGINQVEPDSIFDVTNGAYYGHPDPARGEYVLDAGNTGGTATDGYQFGAYPNGQQPDRSYTRPIYSFGNNYSPDGILQYTAVGGKNTQLNGYLLVARYSSGSDIVALKTGSNGSITSTEVRIDGFAGLNSPLDLVEDPTNGNVYVTELIGENSQGQIRLLTATGGGSTGTGVASVNKTKLSFYVTPGDKNGATNSVTLTNTGSGDLVFNRNATKITGVNRTNYVVTNLPSDNVTLSPGDTLTFNVKGVLGKGQSIPATQHSTLAISVGGSYATVNLRMFLATTSTQSLKTQSFTPGHTTAASDLANQTDSVISQLDSAKDLI